MEQKPRLDSGGEWTAGDREHARGLFVVVMPQLDVQVTAAENQPPSVSVFNKRAPQLLL
jgi:hypothetical protein